MGPSLGGNHYASYRGMASHMNPPPPEIVQQRFMSQQPLLVTGAAAPTSAAFLSCRSQPAKRLLDSRLLVLLGFCLVVRSHCEG